MNLEQKDGNLIQEESKTFQSEIIDANHKLNLT